jgi:hypothetical protein
MIQVDFDRFTQAQCTRGFDHWGSPKWGLQLGEIETRLRRQPDFGHAGLRVDRLHLE